MPPIGKYCLHKMLALMGNGRQSFRTFAARPKKRRTIEAVLNKHSHDRSPYTRASSARQFGETTMVKFLMSAAIAGSLVGLTSVVEARSLYDGSWDLVFVTQRGTCDPNYSFTVNINDGLVTHPNLVRFKGYVARSGAVRASVTVQDKYASGIGKLSNNTGRGTWRGYSGTTRCSGYWTAQRN
jgi:hypothetical protein